MSHFQARRALTVVAALALTVPLSTSTFAADGDEFGPEMISTTEFSDGYGAWWVTEDALDSISVESGALCIDVAGGTPNPWSTIVGINDIPLQRGLSYEFTYSISGTTAHRIRALVQQDRGTYASTFEGNPETTPDAVEYTQRFTSNLEFETGQIVFQVGAADTDWRFCLHGASFRTSPPPEAYQPETGPAVRVNQVGYLSTGPQRANLISESATPLIWELLDAQGAVLGDGQTTVEDRSESIGVGVHGIDFTAAAAGVTGAGFTLRVGDEVSYPFSIGDVGYAQLYRDALTYFYLARSGTPIDGAVVGDEIYTRAAGHIDVPPNQGDGAVPCHEPFQWHDGWTCDYTLDVTGGWYDAGDHGKYVVNGGIAVYQLLDTWDRAVQLYGIEAAQSGRLGDDSAQLPQEERGNGVPDILDEARWELEWMAKMVVPAGEQYAGMVHHKVQDESWTGLPLLPDQDDKPRQLHRPSTAATLNFAAVAAKASRLYEKYDAGFAVAMRAAAVSAWEAAMANPAVFASSEDGASGGGPYNDTDVSDEFYWAAAELYLATGEQQYADSLQANPNHLKQLYVGDGFSWQSVHMLGAISLATVPSDLSDRAAVRAYIVDQADFYLKAQSTSVFGQAFNPHSQTYPWGSNSSIMNNAIVLAVASDLTGEATYRDAAVESFDYLLGRNVLNLSYITGYGTVSSHNQHHRWMAPSLRSTLPPVYPGTVAGGPNSNLEDSVAKSAFPQGCAAQWCYLDDIQSFATNEMTINWNSALTWYAAWAADVEAPTGVTQGGGATLGTGSTWTLIWVGVGVIVMVGGVVHALRRKPEDSGAEATAP